MVDNLQQKIKELFESIKIRSTYSSDVITIDKFMWNGDYVDFLVEYYIGDTKYIFHYNKQIAKKGDKKGLEINPYTQLKAELMYIKRMYERGIGAKEYYPFTSIQ